MQQGTAPSDKPASAAMPDENGATPSALDGVNAPVRAADVTLASGRRYELEAGAGADRLVIRGRGGDVVLRIEVTDRGPVLSFGAAEIDIAAARRLHLSAEHIDVETTGDLSLVAGGSLTQRAAGHHHVAAGGDVRVEAAAVELQANRGGVGVRAMRAIALDGEHIGLNDLPLPQPFPWSEPAAEKGNEGDP